MVATVGEWIAWRAYRLAVASRDRGRLGAGADAVVARLHRLWMTCYLERCAAADQVRAGAAGCPQRPA